MLHACFGVDPRSEEYASHVGPIKVLSRENNATRTLILIGMLEYFSRAGFESVWPYFDRKDDPHNRLRLADACAMHGIFSSWLGSNSMNLDVRLQTRRGSFDRWSSSNVVEVTSAGLRDENVEDVFAASEGITVDDDCVPAMCELTSCSKNGGATALLPPKPKTVGSRIPE